MEASPHSGQTFFPIKDLTVGTRLGFVASTKGFGGGKMSETGAVRGTSTQDFLVGGGATSMDSEALALPLFEAAL